jgi:Zn-dependent peptidase ImmA (M78 family)
LLDFSKIWIPRLSNEEIRFRADEFRLQHWGDKIPVDVELIAERDLGLTIIPIADLRYAAHTEAFLSGDLRELVYDPSLPDVRVRFSVAHELGHYLLHREIISKLRGGSYEEWKEMQQEIPEALWSRAEYQAYEFAGRLLVPPQMLTAELRKLKPLVELARKQMPDLTPDDIKEHIATKAARAFFVSYDVVMRRLDAEGISPIQE